MDGDEMKVFADNQLVWKGLLGRQALSFDGPIGMRSDNARLQVELRAPEPREAQPERAPGCRNGPGESE
jgi:hypothetical protein